MMAECQTDSIQKPNLAEEAARTPAARDDCAVSLRFQSLRSDVMARQGSFVRNANPLVCDVALWRSFAEGQSRVQRRAAFLRELVALAPVDIGPRWTLAGEHLRPLNIGVGASNGPAHAARFAEFGIDAAEAENVRRCAGAWNADAVASVSRGVFQTDVGFAAAGSAAGKGGWGGDLRGRCVLGRGMG